MPICRANQTDVESLRELRNHFATSSYATFDEAPLSTEAVGEWIISFEAAGSRTRFQNVEPLILFAVYCSGGALS